MAKAVRFPIRAKLLAWISFVLILATVCYLAVAIRVFKQDKTALLYENGAAVVKTLAAQVESYLSRFADKATLLTQGHREPAWVKAILEADGDLAVYSLYQRDPSVKSAVAGWKEIFSVTNPAYLKRYGDVSGQVAQLKDSSKIPFDRIVGEKTLVLNRTPTSGAPILTLALAIQIEGADLPHVAVMDLKMDRILDLLRDSRIGDVYLVDSRGTVMGHPDSAKVIAREDRSTLPWVRESLDSPLPFMLKQWEHEGSHWIAAFSKVGVGGSRVILEVPQRQVLLAASRLVEKSVMFAGALVTAALLLSGLLARGITRPISDLVEATEKLARWDFGGTVHVEGKDELAVLARAFNSMSLDLQRQGKELKEQNIELERKVRERTSALEEHQKQVSTAQEALVRTTRLASLGELAGSAAHEILNPVNNMNIRIEKVKGGTLPQEESDLKLMKEILGGWASAYQEGGWDRLKAELSKSADATAGMTLIEEDLKNLNAIVDDQAQRAQERKADWDFMGTSVQRVTRIINNMRSLSRVGGDRRILDIHQPIDETLLTLTDAFEKRGVSLVKEYSAEIREKMHVLADRDELIQVFSNLIRNALQAIGSAKRRAGVIRIRTARVGGKIEIRIEDNGGGIKPEHLAKIFEPTFTTKSADQGTGLGLSISRRLIRAFDGEIEVESSQEDVGTVFLVTLPAADSAPRAPSRV